MDSVEVFQDPFLSFSSNSGIYLVSMTICWKHLQILQQVSHLTSLVALLISPSGKLVPLSRTTSNPSSLDPAAHSVRFASPHKALVTSPKPFDSFLLQCWLAFAQRPRSFQSDQARVYYVMGSLRGKAAFFGFTTRVVLQPGCLSYARVHVLLRITPWSSGPCRRMPAGTRRHSGECSFRG